MKHKHVDVKGRSILENLTIIRDTIDYININNQDAALISLYQEKAF